MRNNDLRSWTGGFEDLHHYQLFCELLNQSEDWEKVPTLVPYSTTGLQEAWYRHKATAEVWLLVEPDAPFPGLWQPR